LWLFSGTDKLAEDSVAGYLAYLAYKTGNDMSAEVYVTGPDEDVNGTFFVYGWGAPPS
jgi:hypothetical protein